MQKLLYQALGLYRINFLAMFVIAMTTAAFQIGIVLSDIDAIKYLMLIPVFALHAALVIIIAYISINSSRERVGISSICNKIYSNVGGITKAYFAFFLLIACVTVLKIVLQQTYGDFILIKLLNNLLSTAAQLILYTLIFVALTTQLSLVKLFKKTLKLICANKGVFISVLALTIVIPELLLQTFGFLFLSLPVTFRMDMLEITSTIQPHIMSVGEMFASLTVIGLMLKTLISVIFYLMLVNAYVDRPNNK